MQQYQPPTQYAQPYYAPPPPPPKKKSIWPILAIISSVLFIGLLLFAVAVWATKSIPTSQNRATSDWQVTINSTSTSTGDAANTPKAGNIFLLISFTAKNTDTNAQDMSHSLFSLRDAQGTTYDRGFVSVPNTPDGPVASGEQLLGDLSYEVPKSLHTFVLQFDGNSQTVQWTITK